MRDGGRSGVSCLDCLRERAKAVVLTVTQTFAVRPARLFRQPDNRHPQRKSVSVFKVNHTRMQVLFPWALLGPRIPYSRLERFKCILISTDLSQCYASFKVND
jgi:hypothetical protein